MNHPLINFSRESLYAQFRSLDCFKPEADGSNPKFPSATGIETKRCLRFRIGTFVSIALTNNQSLEKNTNRYIPNPKELPIEMPKEEIPF